MGFITKTFSHLGGTFLGRLWETAAGGPLVTTSLPVDQWGTPIDFSQLPEIATEFRDMQMAAGTPEAIATGQKGQLQGDRYKVLRVSLAQGGREAPFFLLREVYGQTVFSNTASPVVASIGLAMDSRVNKPVAARVINGVHRVNSAAAGLYSEKVYTGPMRWGRLRARVTAAYPVYVKLYDLAEKPTDAAIKANPELYPPVLTIECDAGATTDISLHDYVAEKGLVLRITKLGTDGDDTAIALGDIRSLNLSYAR